MAMAAAPAMARMVLMTCLPSLEGALRPFVRTFCQGQYERRLTLVSIEADTPQAWRTRGEP